MRLEHKDLLGMEWLENNKMKLSEEKCHLLVSEYKYENVWVKMRETILQSLLTWMFHSRKINRKINQLQEWPLRILYDDYTSLFKDLIR